MNQNIPGFDWPELRTPPATNTAPAGVPPTVDDGRGECTLTIDQPYARMYVDGVAKRYLSSALLKAAWKKSNKRSRGRDTPYGDALFDGYWSLLTSADEWVSRARQMGCLLHLVPA